MKKTPYTEKHIKLGAKMHEFGGYNMPIEYEGIINEHITVCEGVGVFDVSHMGEVWVKGPNAKAFLQKVTSNDVSTLEIGKAQYTCLLNEKGGVIDDIIVYRYEPDKYMLVTNASNTEKDWAWLKKNNTENAELENATDAMGLLAIQGPKAMDTIQKLTQIDLKQVPSYSFTIGSIKGAGLDTVIISNTGYTGAGGYEIYFNIEQADQVWDAVFDAGKEFGIKPIGLGARDTLRMEMGFCLYGNELNEDITTLEAGLGWVTKFVDGKNFIGRKALEKLKEEGLTRRLCAFKLEDKGIPRTGYEIVNEKDEVIGEVTSGTMSPTLKQGIGMGYVKPEYAKMDTPIFIKVRNRNLKAIVSRPPFRK